MNNTKIIYPTRTISTELITKEKAMKLMKNNIGNRPIKPSIVKKYEKLIMEGNFKPNGDCIIIDKHGKLINGQHRCQAIINTGKSIYLDIVYGADKSDIYRINNGRTTSTTDNGHILLVPLGLKADMYGTIARIVKYEETGKNSSNFKDISPEKVESFAKNHYDICSHLSNRHAESNTMISLKPHAKVMEYIFFKLNPKKAVEFFNDIYNNNIIKDTPIWVLDKFFHEKVKKIKAQGGENEATVAYIIAWNAYVQNKPISHIKPYSKDGILKKIEPVAH